MSVLGLGEPGSSTARSRGGSRNIGNMQRITGGAVVWLPCKSIRDGRKLLPWRNDCELPCDWRRRLPWRQRRVSQVSRWSFIKNGLMSHSPNVVQRRVLIVTFAVVASAT